MKEMRYIDLGYVSLPMLHAIEEAIAYKGEPTFMLWIASPKTASIGYFQSVEKELNVDACKELGVEISRRPSGGGAAYFDEKELYYSIVAKWDSGYLPKNFQACFRVATTGLINALREFGLEGTFTGKNDVLVQGKKISGNAQTNMHKAKIQHGTFLTDFDYEIAASVLKIPKQKLEDKGVSTLKERVTTLKELLGREVSHEEAKKAMLKGFAEALDVEFYEGKLSDEEKELAEKFVEKYRSREWIYKR